MDLRELIRIAEFCCGNPWSRDHRGLREIEERALQRWLDDGEALFVLHDAVTRLSPLSPEERHPVVTALETLTLAIGLLQARKVAADERNARKHDRSAARRQGARREPRAPKRRALEEPDLIDHEGRRYARAVLAEDTIPSALWPLLPAGRRGAYLRVAMAAGRCFVGLEDMVGQTPLIIDLRAEAWAACFGARLDRALHVQDALRELDVLLLGPTGAGKEVVARAIQEGTLGDLEGGRAPSLQTNVASISESLAASTLFGVVKGAFTGAEVSRAGLVEQSDGGTLFLDEVGDLPEKIQVDLLRVLERDEVNRVGEEASMPRSVDVRYVAATHKPLAERVKEGRFREDLFHRLGGIQIALPSLVERGRRDITVIARRLLVELTENAPPVVFREADAAFERFFSQRAVIAYHWPGNVRELRNVVKNLVSGREPRLGAAVDARPAIGDRGARPLDAAFDHMRSEGWSEARLCAWYAHGVLRQTGSLSDTARALGLAESTLRRRAKAPGTGEQ